MIETTSEGDAWAPDGPRTPPRLKRVGHGVFEPPAKNVENKLWLEEWNQD